ncbi:phosphoserine phosphatase SerB [Curtobacterium ammoniigenes]|uniref:phosphoserine phosphatase SerB n=1 Tax=Curtobacterium ammoniigenes TaxID=395387 RepID=UPI0008339D37|nr:phosphoserine phosphatase SerB [Curtobacterium ammoniigenes]
MPRFLVVLDADSTLLDDEVIELLADEAGCGREVAAITARAMAGELDFAASLRERVRALAGLPAQSLTRVRARVRVTAGASELIRGVHGLGGAVGVVSGGFHEVLDPIADALDLDYCRANRLAVAGSVLTGQVDGSIVDASAKADALIEWSADAGVPIGQTIAIGDGANDLRMMAVAGLSIAFDAKPVVRATADVSLNERDLSTVLALLGTLAR